MPGLIRGVARTAVIAGTATAVSNGVSRRQYGRWEKKAQEEQAQQQRAPAVEVAWDEPEEASEAAEPESAWPADPPLDPAPAARQQQPPAAWQQGQGCYSVPRQDYFSFYVHR